MAMRTTVTTDIAQLFDWPKWSITLDGQDFNGKPIVMVRKHGKPWTRCFSLPEARRMIQSYS